MQVPLSEREYSTFGVEYFLSCGLDVEIWECTHFLHPFCPQVTQHNNVRNLIKSFTLPRDVVDCIKKLPPKTVVINLLPKQANTLRIFSALNSSNIYGVEVRTNAIPTARRTLKQSLIKLSPARLANFILRRGEIWPRLAGHPHLIIYGGAVCRPDPKETNQMLSAHALDYDAFLAFSQKTVTEENKIVFLDQYLPFHPDFILLNKQPPVTPGKYYPSLCNFFDILEQKLGMPVIIAAHPRAPQDYGEKFFANREIIKGQTLPLVCQSKLTLAHTSTAVNFAVMAKRPVLLLSSEELIKTQNETIHIIAKCLGAPILNIDNLGDTWDKNLLHYDQASYKAYFNNYIKEEGSSQLPFWHILMQFLKNSCSTAPI